MSEIIVGVCDGNGAAAPPFAKPSAELWPGADEMGFGSALPGRKEAGVTAGLAEGTTRGLSTAGWLFA